MFEVWYIGGGGGTPVFVNKQVSEHYRNNYFRALESKIAVDIENKLKNFSVKIGYIKCLKSLYI